MLLTWPPQLVIWASWPLQCVLSSAPGCRQQCPPWVHSGQPQLHFIPTSAQPGRCYHLIFTAMDMEAQRGQVTVHHHPACKMEPGFGPQADWLHAAAPSPAPLPRAALPQPPPHLCSPRSNHPSRLLWPLAGAQCSSLPSLLPSCTDAMCLPSLYQAPPSGPWGSSMECEAQTLCLDFMA